jgi:hypothetical protein
VAPYVTAPLFVLNSKYDTWQAAQIIGATADCRYNISACAKPLKDFWVGCGKHFFL